MATGASVFEPINKDHAIVEMAVFFEFLPDLSAVASSFAIIKDALGKKFPRVNPTQLFKFEIRDNNSQAFSPMPAGLQLSRYLSDGAIDSMINIALPNISFHCLQYSRWEKIWPEMYKDIVEVFKILASAPSSDSVVISGMGLKYIDRYMWNGSGAAYDAKKLFKADTDFLHKHAFTSGHKWHCHTGWFKDNTQLNQLNVDSAEQPISGETKIMVNIDHTQILRNVSEYQESLPRFAENIGKTECPYNNLMQKFHDENKLVLLKLLTPTVAERINLKAKA